MVDFEYSETGRAHSTPRTGFSHAGDAEGAPRVTTLVNWAGAVVSLGLVVGMGVWAYQLTMRDVSGVPVIRALEGPMRVAPADPGGVQAQHQGLAVNRIAEGGEAAPVPDRLVLAPPPVDLNDVALVSASAPAILAPSGPSAAMTDDAPGASADTALSAVPTAAAVNAQTQALIDRLIARAEPLAPVTAPAAAPADTPADTAAPIAAQPAVQIIPASVPGPARSLRPATRPASLSLARAIPPAAATVAEVDAASLAEGTRLVQLGAFDSPEIARAEWDRLTARFPDYFAGRSRVIQQASAGGSAFYRLRAHGFEDLAASRRFCAALMAQSAPCIPVTVR